MGRSRTQEPGSSGAGGGTDPLDRNRDADPNLDPEDIVRCSAQLWVLADVAMQVDVIDECKVLCEVPSHAVEGEVVDEAIVGDETDDSVAPIQAIGGPTEELHIDVRQGVLVGGR